MSERRKQDRTEQAERMWKNTEFKKKQRKSFDYFNGQITVG